MKRLSLPIATLVALTAAGHIVAAPPSALHAHEAPAASSTTAAMPADAGTTTTCTYEKRTVRSYTAGGETIAITEAAGPLITGITADTRGDGNIASQQWVEFTEPETREYSGGEVHVGAAVKSGVIDYVIKPISPGETVNRETNKVVSHKIEG